MKTCPVCGMKWPCLAEHCWCDWGPEGHWYGVHPPLGADAERRVDRETCPATAASWGHPTWRCELPVNHEPSDHQTQDLLASSPTTFIWEDES